ncbi:MAG: tetratricopeptide repeat protein [Deltaproteobacteria bacterium]|nr:tetratricopeptide repeat protein [Deltaproteobacteria bacterium]
MSGIKNEDPEPAARLMSAVTVEQNFEKAKEFHRKGSLREAVTLYREVLTTDPGHIDALNNLGVIYLHSNDLDMAGANFEKAIRLNPENVNSFYNMACLNARKGDISRSLVNLEKALSLDQSVREWARNDNDLKNLQGDLKFENIIGEQGIRNAGFE